MSFCTLWGEQAAWKCWTTAATRTREEHLVSRHHPMPLDHFISASFLPSSPIHGLFLHHHFLFLNFHTGFLHPSILSSIISSIQPTYILSQPPWQIIPPSVLPHLRRHPALPLFILTTIPSHLLSCPTVERPALTSSSSFCSLCSLSSTSPCPPSAVPRSSSNLENTERKRVKTRLKKLILKRPPLQALHEKGLIKGKICVWKLVLFQEKLSTILFFVEFREVCHLSEIR